MIYLTFLFPNHNWRPSPDLDLCTSVAQRQTCSTVVPNPRGRGGLSLKMLIQSLGPERTTETLQSCSASRSHQPGLWGQDTSSEHTDANSWLCGFSFCLFFYFLFGIVLDLWKGLCTSPPCFSRCYYLMWLVHIPQPGNRVWISLMSFFCSAIQSETSTWHLVLMSPSSLICDSPSFLALRHLDTFEERWSVICRMPLVGVCAGVSWLDAGSHFWWEEQSDALSGLPSWSGWYLCQSLVTLTWSLG